jgi:SAM-dependent methyltransferase
MNNIRKLTLGERALLSLAKPEGASAGGATVSYSIDNCLDFPRFTIPGFEGLIHGKVVLDHGCGPGWQSVAMRTKCGAARVFGLDIVPEWFEHGAALARQHGCAGQVSFGPAIPPDLKEAFDIVLSLSAFEHYADPAAELQRMRSHLKPGGFILLAFAEPWYSPYGSHFSGYTRIPGTGVPVPWLNLLFSDRALLTLRERFRPDHPGELENISGGLNRLSVARFERIVASSGMRVEQMRLFAVKRLPLVTQIPVLRELFTSAASCVLYR